MSTHRLIGVLVALGAALAGAEAAFAAELRDPKTGLAVNPPAGFTARIADEPDPILKPTVEIVVEREQPETSCSVTFEETSANLGFTQEQLNEAAKSQVRLDTLRASVGAVNEILSLDFVTQDGVVGVVLILKPRMGFLAHMRSYQAIFETRRGRTANTCATRQEQLDGFRQDYASITSGVTFPR